MRILSFLLLCVTGLGMALPGLYLLLLGGSPYYAIAGPLILVSAWLVLRRRSAGIVLFWLVFAATLVWSLWEVGPDGWALMPRLVYLAIAGFWLLLSQRIGETRRAAVLLPILVLGAAAAIGFWWFNPLAS